MIEIKRAYEATSGNDGYRVLVDRLWPRGISKEKLALNLWLKDIAPSAGLRQWFNHDPEKFKEFKVKYQDELADNAAVKELRDIIKSHQKVTLIYGAKDPNINQAVVLKDYLES